MEEGRLPYNTYVRCTKKILTCPAGGIARADYAGGVSRMQLGAEALIISSVSVTRGSGPLLKLGFYRCINALLAAGAEPESLQVQGQLPTEMTEQELKDALRLLDELCRGKDMTLLPGDLQVSSYVSAPCLGLTAFGRRTGEKAAPHPGDALLMVGSVGLLGSGLLTGLCREQLLKRFSADFLKQAEEKLFKGDIRPITRKLLPKASILPVAEGGVLAALWDLKTASGLGFQVDLRSMPMYQEVVEITEYLEVNPYRLAGDGAVLAAVQDPEKALEALLEAGFDAAVIGTITEGPAGDIRKDDEISSISRPEQDELYKFL
jgi:hydrogenase maturation factor